MVVACLLPPCCYPAVTTLFFVVATAAADGLWPVDSVTTAAAPVALAVF